MIDWVLGLFRQAAAEMIFLSICIFGAVVSGFSLVFGGSGDGDADHGDAGGDHGDGHGDHSDHHGIGIASFFSVRGISLMAVGFGATGYLVQHYTGKTLLASVSGLLGAVSLAFVGLSFVRMFFQQEASSLVASDKLVGRVGSVVLSIPAAEGGRGEVALVVGGTQMIKPAVTSDPETIRKGASVRVVRASSDVVQVERAV